MKQVVKTFLVIVVLIGQQPSCSSRETTPMLIRIAESGESIKVRNEACEQLGIRKDTAAVPALVRFLDDPVLQWCAARSLGQIADARATSSLRAHLVLLDSSGVNRMAVWALGLIGDTSAAGDLTALESSPLLNAQDSSAIREALTRLRR